MPIGDTFVALQAGARSAGWTGRLYGASSITARAASLTRGYTAMRCHVPAIPLVRGYATAGVYGGGGGAGERPLVGLLHPPGRRGNRASA